MTNNIKTIDRGMFLGFIAFVFIILILIGVDQTDKSKQIVKTLDNDFVTQEESTEMEVAPASPEIFESDEEVEEQLEASTELSEIYRNVDELTKKLAGQKKSLIKDVEPVLIEDFILEPEENINISVTEMDSIGPLDPEVDSAYESMEFHENTLQGKRNGLSRLEKLKNIYNVEESWKPKIETCKMEEFGIQYKCDLNWKLDRQGENDLVILSLAPIVTMSLARVDVKKYFIEQISVPYLKQLNSYDKGFQMERVKFGGRDAIFVKAFSRESPDIRLADYYYIHGSELYSVKFSVYPKDRWEEGKYIVKKIASTFSSL